MIVSHQNSNFPRMREVMSSMGNFSRISTLGPHTHWRPLSLSDIRPSPAGTWEYSVIYYREPLAEQGILKNDWLLSSLRQRESVYISPITQILSHLSVSVPVSDSASVNISPRMAVIILQHASVPIFYQLMESIIGKVRTNN